MAWPFSLLGEWITPECQTHASQTGLHHMLRRLLLAFTVALFGLASNATAQCSDLDLRTRSTEAESFQLVRIGLSRTLPEAPHVLVISQAPGRTLVNLGGSQLLLGLQAPLRTMRLGPSDENGRLVRYLRARPDLNLVLYAQTVGVQVGLDDSGPVMRFCTSDVAKMEL